MRLRFLFVSAASLLVTGSLTPAVAAPTFPFQAQTKRDGANIRAGSTVTAEALAQLPSGSPVEVIGEYAGWYRVRLPKSASCYVASQYVNTGGVITGSRVNVRAGAGRQCSILGQVQHDDRVTVVERHGEWARIEPPSTLAGWIRADLVAPAEPAAAPAATASGVLESTRGFLQPTEFRLTQAGQTTHYLRTDQDVSEYRHLQVNVWGAVDPHTRAAHPVVVVERVERAR